MKQDSSVSFASSLTGQKKVESALQRERFSVVHKQDGGRDSTDGFTSKSGKRAGFDTSYGKR